VTGERPELDVLPVAEVVGLLLDAESRVLPAVRAQSARIAEGAELVARALAGSGRLVLAGAGTSGRIAWAEAAELPGTFGLEPDRVLGRMAGGLGADDRSEDDLAAAAADLADLALTPEDVLVAVAASGSTPYTLALARGALERRAAVVAVVTVTSSPLAALADVAIEAIVGAELLRGSTRLGAGTAQKVALDTLTTAAMARLGRVHGDLMVDVVTANAKLQERAAAVVAEVAGCDLATAREAVSACEGNTRAAVVRVLSGVSPAQAAALVAAHRSLRDALASSGSLEA
jgi:N-acetylmuramic acid 6-phosphate etherase